MANDPNVFAFFSLCSFLHELSLRIRRQTLLLLPSPLPHLLLLLLFFSCAEEGRPLLSLPPFSACLLFLLSLRQRDASPDCDLRGREEQNDPRRVGDQEAFSERSPFLSLLCLSFLPFLFLPAPYASRQRHLDFLRTLSPLVFLTNSASTLSPPLGTLPDDPEENFPWLEAAAD